jgi:predicted ATPase
MTLRAGLGTALSYTSGPIYEAQATWQRVLELADGLDDVEYQLRALYGLWLYRILVCEYRAALDLTQKFQQVAERVVAAPDVPTADRMMAMVLHYLGDQAGARDYAYRSLGALVPGNRQVYAARYGVDQRVGALVQLARALWLQGLPDQAMQAAQASVDEAVAVGHANSLCLALADGACIVALLSGDLARAERFAAMLDEHADRYALGVWRTYARALQGRLVVRDGRVSDGAALLKSALADLRETPFDIRFQLYLVWLAEVLGATDQVSGAMAAIVEAQERAERTEERWYLAEILRIRGELLVRGGGAGATAEASEYFARSLDLARGQNALSWELRSTMSVVRLRRGGENAVELRALLDGTLGRFGEGFGTEDLIAARDLLDALDR